MNNTIVYQYEQVIQLSPKQKEIIDLLLRFRYLTRPQIQTFLNHKTRERIRRWLNDLVSKQVLYRFYEEEFSAKPSFYCLDKGVIKYLKVKQYENTVINRMYKEKKHSQSFFDRCITIASVYLSLSTLTKKNDTKLRFVTHTELNNVRIQMSNVPDAFFHITGKDDVLHPYFIDVLTDTKYMYKRVYEYILYHKSYHWQRKTKTSFPVIIFICFTEDIKKRLYGFIKRRVTSDMPSFYVITKKDVEEYGLRGDRLIKAI